VIVFKAYLPTSGLFETNEGGLFFIVHVQSLHHTLSSI